MNITGLSIRNDRVVWTALLGIIIMGATTFTAMPRSESPPYTVRNAQIVTRMPGASPDRVEQLVTDKIEKKLREMPEVNYVSSTSKTGISIITVAIKESHTDMRPIWDDLRRKVEEAQPDLPDSAGEPSVNSDLGDVYEVTYAMVGEGFSYAEMWDVAQEIRDEFLLSPDVAKVEIVGEQDERVFIEYDNARLSELGLSPQSLQMILASQNITAPGGSILTERETIVIEPSGNYESVRDIARTTLNVPGRTDLIFLEDIAEVRRGTVDPPKSRVFLNGERALSISASMRKGGDVIGMGADLARRVKGLESVYPIGIEFQQIVHVPERVQSTVDNFVNNLLQAVAVVLLVMLIFLGVRTGLVVVTLVPMTMLLTLGLMGVFDIGLHQVSLAALIIALGMLVDNAIVMAEAVLVRMEAGVPAVEAAVESAKELRVPLLVASLTTSAAFLPIALAESMVGEFTASLFQVVTIALLCSWLLAMTMIPLFCVLFIKIKSSAKTDEADGPAILLYRKTLAFCLRHKWVPQVLALAAFIGAISLFGRLPKVFFPGAEGTYFTVSVSMPTGTPFGHTESAIEQLDAFIKGEMSDPNTPEGHVTHWGSFVGEGIPAYGLGKASGPASSDGATLMVNVDRPDFNDPAMRKIERFALESFPDAQIVVQGATNGPGGGTPIQIRVYGRETGKTFELVEGLKTQLRQIEGTMAIQDNWGQRSKKLLVQIDQEQAKRAGISSQDIATSLRTGFTGLTVTEYREGDTAIPVTLRSVASDRQDLSKLETIDVLSQSSGKSVPLLQVADVVLTWENAKRLRRDGLTAVTVSSELKPGFNAAAITAQITPWLEEASQSWPQGYSFEIGGENEQSDEANASIFDKLPLAALIILVLLISQFNSLRRALIVLSTIPLALIGVIPGLYVSGQSFGFMTLLGVVSLAGIVINNAIVLLDRIRIEIEEEGKTPFDGVIDAARQRVRPILLTTVTTISGMIPLYLGGGSMWESMAMAIMSGLLVSTVLTLVVIPTIYATLFGVRAPEPPPEEGDDEAVEEGLPEAT